MDKRKNVRNNEEDIYNSLSVEYQRFLVILSQFKQWPPEVVTAIGSTVIKSNSPKGKKAKPFFDLPDSVFFYDATLNAFTFKQGFLDFLKARQCRLSPDEIKSSRAIFAEWCMKNFLYIDAAINYGMAGDYAHFVKAYYSTPRLLSSPTSVSIMEVIDLLLADKNRNETDENYLIIRHVTRAGLLLNLGRDEEARQSLYKSIREFEALPPSPLSSRILSSCYNTLGPISIITYRQTGDLSRTYDYFLRGNYYQMRCPYTVSGPMAKTSMGSYVNLIAPSPKPGEFEKFANTIAMCVPHASYSMGGFLSGVDSLCRAELAFFKGDLADAEKHAREAVSRAHEKEQFETESKSLFYLLRIHLCAGNASAAEETWNAIGAQLETADYVNRYIINDITTGWFFAHTGEIERIAPWLRNEFEESDLNGHIYNYETMVKAKSLFAEKRYTEALNFIRGKEVMEGLGSYHLGILEITALEAVILNNRGDEKEALESLERAYKISSAESLDMPFMELGENMRTLTAAALNSKKCAIPRAWLEEVRTMASVYAKKLLTVTEHYRVKHNPERLPFFTSQELLILTAISHGSTREEIAKDFSLSINTVKNSIKTIYAKLDALNRADAIRIAANLGLLK